MTGRLDPFQRRRAGMLLHPTSLPGSGSCGTLGADAYRFVDFLAASGHTVWQTLPLGPPDGHLSPYQCLSAHAGNPCFISAERLVEQGWLPAQELPLLAKAEVGQRQRRLVPLALAAFEGASGAAGREELAAFVQTHAHWLDDYALYMVLREVHLGRPWTEWPEELRDRHPAALARARKELDRRFEQQRFAQFLFFQQWAALKRHANERGVLMFGDMPIFASHDSADVWAHREFFQLDERGYPRVVAGVPPDYFSQTGQRWGNPLYDWERIAADGFRWWIERLDTQLTLFDLLRIDHFRGFEAYWEIPAGEPNAVHGRWVKAPGEALFEALRAHCGTPPLVAEDLGVITPEVEALRDRYGFPGMKILQFAFEGGSTNPYLPHNHTVRSVVYTGTHDNDTTVGWVAGLSDGQHQRVVDYFGMPREDMPWPLIRAALASVARLAIIPMQDMLALGSEARMNRPSTLEDNWRWRFSWEQVAPDMAGRLQHLVRLYGRGADWS